MANGHARSAGTLFESRRLGIVKLIEDMLAKGGVRLAPVEATAAQVKASIDDRSYRRRAASVCSCCRNTA
jgi:hypothetical protein